MVTGYGHSIWSTVFPYSSIFINAGSEAETHIGYPDSQPVTNPKADNSNTNDTCFDNWQNQVVINPLQLSLHRWIRDYGKGTSGTDLTNDKIPEPVEVLLRTIASLVR
jgi:hypothetical protein